MPGPAPKPLGTTQRKKAGTSKAVLSTVVDHDIPTLPPAEEWLRTSEELVVAAMADVPPDELAHDWPEPVKRWWNDIWSSPMSNEFVHSDIHGLYLACFYMAQVLNPALKMSDRISASKAYETQVRNFGLNPMSRRTLQWEIERSEEAKAKGEARRKREANGAPAAAPSRPDPRRRDESGEHNPFTVVS
ncbi:hypothetical protein SEA_PATIO_2 [Gordonia phage Patio]|uniref:Terminase small subunit n=1 Tax=Gordonia phage Patio TaxID=2041515 RepID=A0A2D2W4G6_9CAUD|nr:minor tail protein [Gordonia phage Patio]ATS93084.1 hypothetical protein SEA_PATIO_2 [Gordonia phage Patio]